MRRRAGILSCSAIVLVLLSGAGTSSASNPTKGADIYGVGGGKSDFGITTFDLSAHTGPNGDFGRVGVKETTPVYGVEYSVRVDCVNIYSFPSGERGGTISGVVTRVTPVPNPLGVTEGHRFFFFISDGGEPSPPVPVDTFIPERSPLPPADCKAVRLGSPQKNVTQGNVVIKSG